MNDFDFPILVFGEIDTFDTTRRSDKIGIIIMSEMPISALD